MIQNVFFIMLALLLPSLVFAGFREQRLGIIPPEYKLENSNIVFMPDGGTVAFAARFGDQVRVLFGNSFGKLYNEVRMLNISPDGRSVAYSGTMYLRVAGRTKKLEYRVVNNIETGPLQQVCDPIFSPDGSLVVFEAKYANKWHHAISPAEANRITAETVMADINWMPPVFSPDGHFVVTIQLQIDAKKNVRLVSSTPEMLEVRRREYDLIRGVVYSADGRRTAYSAKKAGKMFVVTSSFAGEDVREGAQFDAVSDPVLNVDGSHVAYGAERAGQKFLVVDDQEMLAPFYNDRLKPIFSRDWKAVAYLAIRDTKQFVVFAGKESPGYDDLSGYVISPDGKTLAYGALKNGKWRVVIGENEGQEYDSLDGVQFVPRKKLVAYRAKTGEHYRIVIADFTGREVQQGPLFKEIWSPSFDAEGNLGYGALDGSEIWWKVMGPF
jgi:hypothetical protein